MILVGKLKRNVLKNESERNKKLQHIEKRVD